MEHHVHGMRHLGASWIAFGGAVVGGTGVSPNAKRPNQYVVPDPAMGAKLTIETLSAGLYTTKAAVQNMHNWIGSIAEAVSGHADQLEEASTCNRRRQWERNRTTGIPPTGTHRGESFMKQAWGNPGNRGPHS